MFFDLPDFDTLYAALLARDPGYDGFAFVGVRSTGVFCRLTCPARKPKKENSVFYSTVVEAMEAGFRPCKRCQPLSLFGARDNTLGILLASLENDPEKKWSEEDLVTAGLDPSTVRRTFKRQFGVTFLEMARLRRIGKGVNQLTTGGEVIDAQLEASFESGSGFRAAIVRHLGMNPSQARQHRFLKSHWIETPLGSMLAVADHQALHLLEFVDRPALPNELTRLRNLTSSEIIMDRTPVTDRLEVEMGDYFAGKSCRFATPLVEHGSIFTRGVWDALRAIPAGEVRSYSAVAAAIDRPRATRAVARANGANQIAILIPCHRAIGADGSLTGYGGGLWRKKWLIEHEKRMFSR
ncbi:bifunctional transcriptional activator/DNA repair enzyme AdaA [Acerihabitans arboris]|uniref:methylated-DNA--[protein]-cysteine S-methyltransferase n=1 Tax=Acerihabitans arboris TaxID=2691583 RepID=A0A845SKB3_9GAMM|nr:trifunctional transcriptional activator/DNA repair protein Ada/methylated-DNA--[protein]-cysteine S-methyltransferase [Acerihabitans arboris]NDL63436.1 methylated-DNA--[protein]-cysteine S-methyltransferase [Acerihabitans arboris]